MATLAEHIAEPPIPYTIEALPPVLHFTSDPPLLYDGTTRLYICYKCPHSQRVWMARNFKGLQDKIKLVAINSWNRPLWYKRKVCYHDKVPALEYNGRTHGANSMDLVQYIDKNFPGPSLQPNTPNKKGFADSVLYNIKNFIRTAHGSFTRDDPKDEIENFFGYLEYCLGTYDYGPFFLGDQFSYVDIAYAPFIYRFHLFCQDQFNYDVFEGNPRFRKWLEEMNELECFKETKCDPEVVLSTYRSRFVTLKW